MQRYFISNNKKLLVILHMNDIKQNTLTKYDEGVHINKDMVDMKDFIKTFQNRLTLFFH